MSDAYSKLTAATGQTLWTNSGGSSPFTTLDTPDNLVELVVEVAKTAQAVSDERVKPYRTAITQDTLRVPVG